MMMVEEKKNEHENSKSIFTTAVAVAAIVTQSHTTIG